MPNNYTDDVGVMVEQITADVKRQKQKVADKHASAIKRQREDPRVGFIGIGKLGFPVAVAIAAQLGKSVIATDINPAAKSYLTAHSLETADGVEMTTTFPHKEENIQQYFNTACTKTGNQPIKWAINTNSVVEQADMIFVPVQTPHDPMYEGSTPFADIEEYKDFDYTHLIKAIKDINKAAASKPVKPIVVIISTVLPGTIEREIKIHTNNIRLCYNPFFIAMGTTIKDFLNPEFVLLGVDDKEAADIVTDWYDRLFNAGIPDNCAQSTPEVYQTSIGNAELIKVSYNTFISMKLAYVNTLMQICHKRGLDVDQVTNGLKKGTDRLISRAYLTAGMSDGGGCHPRDNIAMAWLSDQLGMQHNFFEALMESRDAHERWLATHTHSVASANSFKRVMVCGEAFKPETNLTVGSPAKLFKSLLDECNRGKTYAVDIYDPVVLIGNRTPFVGENTQPTIEHLAQKDITAAGPSVFFIATAHKVWESIRFPAGSIVIDPWRYLKLPDDADWELQYVGARTRSTK